MSAFKSLTDSIICLSKSISNFPVGAVSLDDLKPIEDRIRNMRESLKVLNAKLLILKAQYEYQTTTEEPEEDAEDTVTKLYDETAKTLITNAAVKLCVHSYTIQAILTGREGDQDMQKKIYVCMKKLFSLNDSILSVQEELESALKEELELKIKAQHGLLDYSKFLKEQEIIRNKELQKTNPEVARNKEKTNNTLRRINLMKKLIVNFIAASSNMLSENPFLINMLDDHRELLTIDTILSICQDEAENTDVSTLADQ
ncbi:uncharacterized protein LOC143429096 [Xylocopa sonorina]|uniref:uncharacterized protein LOC143429096 n=1 Tax=Xylocopa sonorina TaxID=1818115 RepID=UPI00403AE5EB